MTLDKNGFAESFFFCQVPFAECGIQQSQKVR